MNNFTKISCKALTVYFDQDEFTEFYSWVKKLSRKKKKLINRIAKEEETIFAFLNLDHSKQIRVSITEDGKTHKWLKKCGWNLMEDRIRNSKSYDYPTFLMWSSE